MDTSESVAVATAKPIGAALGRDISPGEKVEKDLDAFISKRDKERRLSEGERAEEAAWVESERRAQATRDARLREEWACYHTEQAARHRANLEALGLSEFVEDWTLNLEKDIG